LAAGSADRRGIASEPVRAQASQAGQAGQASLNRMIFLPLAMRWPRIATACNVVCLLAQKYFPPCLDFLANFVHTFML
jgi:hypothetical protein